MRNMKHGFSVPRVTSGFTKNRFSFHVDDFSSGRNFQVGASSIFYLILGYNSSSSSEFI